MEKSLGNSDLKKLPSRVLMPVGRELFLELSILDHHGIAAYTRYYNDIKLTQQGPSLCLDYKVSLFCQALPINEYLMSIFGWTDFSGFGDNKYDVEKELVGLKVSLPHCKNNHHKHTILGLSDEVTANIDIPCLDLGKKGRRELVPMELCVLVEGQIFPKHELDPAPASRLKQLSLVNPQKRKVNILRLAQSSDELCGTEKFKLGIEKEITHMQDFVGTEEGRLIIDELAKSCRRLWMQMDRPCVWILPEMTALSECRDENARKLVSSTSPAMFFQELNPAGIGTSVFPVTAFRSSSLRCVSLQLVAPSPYTSFPPIYYADIAANRGRMYHDANASSREKKTTQPRESSSSSSSRYVFQEANFKLQKELENVMFYIY
ncbi:unnamed protein product [Arabis nemorensis]|uniref:PAZ domain-containing protein n=1 Tax=Arabis nemorensis TaxID=586526 RepID=A0A565BHW1_9BRAS|nr:unnamed protein product [Arabis nemorensis]